MSADPRDHTEPTLIGTPLRDAAVTPADGDYLPPANAGAPGEAGNPHGPNVVAPGLPDEFDTYGEWRRHVIRLGLPDPGPQRTPTPFDHTPGGAA